MSAKTSTAPIIAVANLKGGVGKTTLAVHLAYYLEALLVDLDPQGDASDWAERSGWVQAHKAPTWAEASRTLAKAEGPLVLDCPPGEGSHLVDVLAAADLVVIPTKAGRQDLRAVGRMLELVKAARKGHRGLQAGLVFNEVKSQTNLAAEVEEALRHLKDASFLGCLGSRQAFVEAFAAGRAVTSGAAFEELHHVLKRTRKLLKETR
jgi:chromosome partitioning protein